MATEEVEQERRRIEPAPHPVVGSPRALEERAEVAELVASELLFFGARPWLRGGVIEPAYQISKLCKAFAREKFVVVIPRQAKSAATLIAIGADEIHMSILGQLGPIDPQLGGLPALGVAQALERIANLSERFPGSAEMFAKYLQQALTVEQIGYCDRIPRNPLSNTHSDCLSQRALVMNGSSR